MKKDNQALAVDPKTALNGAQVTSFRQLLVDVATRQLPRESGVEAISAAFPLSVDQADKVMGEIGRTFFVELKPDQPTNNTPDPAPGSQEQ